MEPVIKKQRTEQPSTEQPSTEQPSTKKPLTGASTEEPVTKKAEEKAGPATERQTCLNREFDERMKEKQPFYCSCKECYAGLPSIEEGLRNIRHGQLAWVALFVRGPGDERNQVAVIEVKWSGSRQQRWLEIMGFGVHHAWHRQGWATAAINALIAAASQHDELRQARLLYKCATGPGILFCEALEEKKYWAREEGTRGNFFSEETLGELAEKLFGGGGPEH